ncbi:alkaline phosphatase D family protein [Micromonospora sp. NPDC005299]|uniref:alkaline phosphatase D family protein n=1 Tax=Micromonospora sp. NPDC005299 TaxID=3364231 RepID=UPI0036900703
MAINPPDAFGRRRLLALASTRRRFLTTGGAAGAVALSTALLGITASQPARSAPPRLPDYPFRLGIASGDPLPDSVVIWTRLVTDPFASFGGMDYRQFPVQWQVATDERFRKVVRAGAVMAKPESAHAVHVDVRGLRPWREYFYRFRVGSYVSPVGRTKTAPPPGAALNGMVFAFASCQSWTSGYYTAYADMASRHHDVVVHLGDYIYEYGARPEVARQSPLPPHLMYPGLSETVTLDQYRDQYALFKADPDLQAAHAAAPWIVTIDDHEVENDWAGQVSEHDDPWEEVFLVRRANAFRAHWEHMPVRRPMMPNGPDMQIYRRYSYGDLAEFNILDTRQYRSPRVAQDDPAWQDPSRTILGAEQEAWLLGGLANTTRRWKIIAQQNTMSRLDSLAGAGERYGTDRWDGYPASRDRILAGAYARGVRNLVSIGGDVHRSIVSDLKLDFDDASSPTVGMEFGGTSIASGGDGVDIDTAGLTTLAENPHVKFVNVQRGYQRCTLTHDRWETDYRVVDFITRPGGTTTTRTRLVTQDGVPGVEVA